MDDKWKETQWDYGVQQDELARGDKDREEAIARIYNHLQAGGSADGLPPDLVAQSGLSAMEIQAIANNSAHQREQSDQKFAAEMAESQASTAAKYASASKTSSGSKGSSGSTKDKYQDKSSNYCRIKSRASDLDDVEEVQAYLDRMISLYEFTGGKTGISEEEAAEMFALDLGYDPEDLYDDTDDVPGGGVPQTYDEFVSATGFSGIMNPDDFEKHMGKSGGKQYKNYQEYLNAMYQKYK